MHADGTCDVKYDDGDFEEKLEPTYIRAEAASVVAPPPAKRQRTAASEEASVCDAPTVYRLCGRVLAKAMLHEREGNCGEYVEDGMPLYVIEYLATDNTCSLDSLDSALAQLEAVDGPHASFLRALRRDKVEATAAALLLEAPARLRTCDLYKREYSSMGVRLPTCRCQSAAPALGTCECAAPCAALSDETLEEVLLEAVRYVLVGCRRANLLALKNGFQGVDQLGGAASCFEGSCYDYSAALATLEPDEIVQRLRGRSISSAADVVDLLRFQRPSEVAGSDENEVDEAVFAQMSGWLVTVVSRLEKSSLELLLEFATSRRTLSVQPDADSEKEAIKMCIYTDRHAPLNGAKPKFDLVGRNADVLTASTCTRVVMVPWRYGMSCESKSSNDSLEDMVHWTLEYHEKERNVMPGGSGFGYE